MSRVGVFSKCFWVVAGCLNMEMGMERGAHLLLSEHHLLVVEDCHPEYLWIPHRQADWPLCAPEIWPWVDIKRSHPLMSMVQYQLCFLCYSQFFKCKICYINRYSMFSSTLKECSYLENLHLTHWAFFPHRKPLYQMFTLFAKLKMSKYFQHH